MIDFFFYLFFFRGNDPLLPPPRPASFSPGYPMSGLILAPGRGGEARRGCPRAGHRRGWVKGSPPPAFPYPISPSPTISEGAFRVLTPPTSLSREVPMRIDVRFGGTWRRSDVAVAEQQTFSTGIGVISPLCVPTAFWSSKKNNFPAFHKFLMGSKPTCPAASPRRGMLAGEENLGGGGGGFAAHPPLSFWATFGVFEDGLRARSLLISPRAGEILQRERDRCHGHLPAG